MVVTEFQYCTINFITIEINLSKLVKGINNLGTYSDLKKPNDPYGAKNGGNGDLKR